MTGRDPWFHFGMSAAAASAALRFGLPALLLAAGWWISYRIVNFPAFADFLIAVEAEMNKVSWPVAVRVDSGVGWSC